MRWRGVEKEGSRALGRFGRRELAKAARGLESYGRIYEYVLRKF